MHELTARGVRVQFVKEQLTFTGEDSPMANLLLSVMGVFAEFERALIRERQREGIALPSNAAPTAGAENPSRSSRPHSWPPQAAAGVPKAQLARDFGVSRETVYQYLRADAPASAR